MSSKKTPISLPFRLVDELLEREMEVFEGDDREWCRTNLILDAASRNVGFRTVSTSWEDHLILLNQTTLAHMDRAFKRIDRDNSMSLGGLVHWYQRNTETPPDYHTHVSYNNGKQVRLSSIRSAIPKDCYARPLIQPTPNRMGFNGDARRIRSLNKICSFTLFTGISFDLEVNWSRFIRDLSLEYKKYLKMKPKPSAYLLHHLTQKYMGPPDPYRSLEEYRSPGRE